MSEDSSMKTEMVSVDKINKSPYNPRIINTFEFDELKKSIKEFGFVEPLVINKRSDDKFKEKGWYIVGGHQRYEAALALGYKEVPVVFVDVPPAKEKILNLALNKISGDWDNDKLSEILFELTNDDLISKEDILGFYDDEIDTILNTVMDTGKGEKEIDENLDTTNKCPKCGYEW